MNNLPVVQNDGGLKELFDANREKLRKIASKSINLEEVWRQVSSCIQAVPRLLECTKDSWIEALRRASEVGLSLSATLGKAHILPYKNNKIGAYEAKFSLGYLGMLELTRNSKKLSSIDVQVVYTKDKFKCVFGTSPILEHEPFLDGDRGKIRCYYTVAKLKDGSTQVEILTKEDADKIKAKSKAAESGPWQDWEDQMGRKSVFKRAWKWLPRDPKVERAIEYDNEATGMNIDDVVVIKADKGVDGLVKALELKQEAEKPQTPSAESPTWVLEDDKGKPMTTVPDKPTLTLEQDDTPPVDIYIGKDVVYKTLEYAKKHGLTEGCMGKILGELSVESLDKVKNSQKDELSRLLKHWANVGKDKATKPNK